MYEVVFLNCARVTPDKLKSGRGKVALSLLEDYVNAMKECFGLNGRSRFQELRAAVDAYAGLAKASRKRGDLSEDIVGKLAWSEEVFFVLDARGEFVAGCTTRLRGDKNPNHIDNVCVAAKHRGRGVCGILIAHVAKLYADRHDDVKIICAAENTGACKCYGKLFRRAVKGMDKMHGPVIRFSGLKEYDVTAAPRCIN